MRVSERALIVLVPCAGCEAPPPPGAPSTLAFETEHFAYYADEPVCDSLGDWMERDYAQVTAWLGTEPRKAIRYYDYGDDADLTEACGGANWGCFLPPTDIVANVWFLREQAVRAYAADLGAPPSFFETGLAQMLGPWSAGGENAVPHDVNIVGMIRGDEDEYYGVPPAFVRYLVDTFGKSAFLGFYGAAPTDPTSSEFETAFEDAFGATIEHVAADWATLPSGDRGDAWMWLPECDAERVPAVYGEGPIAVEPELSCAEIPLDANRVPDQLGTFRTVEVGDGEALHVAAASGAWAYAWIGGCDQYADGDPGLGLAPEDTPRRVDVWADVAPGVWFLGLGEYEQAASSGTSTWEVERAGFPMGSSCEDAGTLDLNAARLSFVGSSGDGGRWYLWMNTTDDSAYTVGGEAFSALGDGTAIGASVCTGTCDALTCVDHTGDLFAPAFTVAAGEPSLLVVQFEPERQASLILNRSD